MTRSVREEREVLRAALAWWKERRPRDYSLEDHIGSPDVNCATPAATRLGKAVAMLEEARPKRKPPRRNGYGLGDGHTPGMYAPPMPTKRERRAAIREKVFARAAEGTPDGVARCEGPLGSQPLRKGRCIAPATDLQHVFGRGKGREPESERNCLAACRTCHEAEGRNDPSGAAWWEWFAEWFDAHDFMREARLARNRAHLERTRSTLPAAPRLNR